MRRRDFITLLCSAAAVWPATAGAQQAGGVRRIGVLMGSVENDPEDQSWVAEFVQQLHKLSWTEGKNIRIDYRWGGGDVSHGELRVGTGRSGPGRNTGARRDNVKGPAAADSFRTNRVRASLGPHWRWLCREPRETGRQRYRVHAI